MKKLLYTILIFTCCLSLIGCNSLKEKKAERAINKYYNALLDENYDQAFTQLYLYDYNFFDEQSLLPIQEAKAIYLKKIAHLQEQSYKVKAFNITELEYEDGHSFWHHVTITVEQYGETFDYKEQAYFHDGKLKISGDDPYIEYRDGKMTIDE